MPSNSDGEQFAVSSPRGGVVTFWSADGKYLGVHEQPDACGIGQSAAERRGFLISDGGGSIVKIEASRTAAEHRSYPD